MKLGYTIIYVQSVPETLSFYKRAFGFETRFCVPSNDYGEVELPGDTTLAFAAESFVEQGLGGGNKNFRVNRMDDSLAPGVEISLVVEKGKGEDIHEVFKKAVGAGAVVVKEPAAKPWGKWLGMYGIVMGFGGDLYAC